MAISRCNDELMFLHVVLSQVETEDEDEDEEGDDDDDDDEEEGFSIDSDPAVKRSC